MLLQINATLRDGIQTLVCLCRLRVICVYACVMSEGVLGIFSVLLVNPVITWFSVDIHNARSAKHL